MKCNWSNYANHFFHQMTLFLLIFQCLCFMKNAGGFEINLNTEKKSNLSVLIVFPNCHFYVDIHKHCSFKQHFASQSFWQYCFPCAASDVKSLNFEALIISLLSAYLPFNVKCLALAPRWLLASASHSGFQQALLCCALSLMLEKRFL